MKFLVFIEEKINFVLFQFFFIFLNSLFLGLLNIELYLILLLDLILLFYTFFYLLFSYKKTSKKVEGIITMMDHLEEAYLAATIIESPKNLENKGYYYALKKACKAMNDKVSKLEQEQLEFEEYVESFAHEIKTPLSVLALSFDNTKNDELKEEVEKVNNLVEQMLYYARSDSTEKDYFVKELLLSDVIHPIILNYKSFFLKKKVILKVHDLDYLIYTDEKWLNFILAQLLQNALKYLDKEDKVIEIYAEEYDHSIILRIIDNGCGIKKADLPRIIEKGFTGTNRKKEHSTGMGLYLAQKLCCRLGLNLQIESEEKKYTKVSIVFPKTNMHKNF